MNLRRLSRSIEETDNLAARSALIERTRTEVTNWLKKLQSKLAGAQSEYAGLAGSLLVLNPVYAIRRQALVMLASSLTLVDLILQMVSWHVGFVNWGFTWLLLASVGMTGLMSMVAHGIGVTLLSEPGQLLRSARRCMTAAGITGVITLAGLTVLFFSRVASADWTPLLERLLPPTLWVVSETMPLVAGFAWAACQALDFPNKMSRKIASLESRIADANRFLVELDRMIEPLPVEIAANSNAKVVGMSLVLLALLLPAVPRSAFAQRATPAATTVCHIRLDGSSSPVAAQRRMAVERLSATLPELTTVAGCRVLDIGIFTDAGQFTPVQRLLVPMPLVSTDCDNAQPALDHSDRALAVLSSFHDYFAGQARAACRLRRQQDAAQYARSWAALQRQFSAVARAAETPSGACTDISGLFSPLLSPGPVVVLTDAADSCVPTSLSHPIAFSDRVIFVLVASAFQPGAANAAGTAALQRAAAWSRALPNFIYIPFPEVQPGLWPMLLHSSQK